jgi:hypothetical protein
MRRSALIVPVLAVLATALTACSDDDDRPTRAITVVESDNGGGVAPDGPADPSETAEPEAGAGGRLDQQQAESALLTVRDLPSGWAVTPDEGDEEDDSEDTIEPERCQTVIDALDDFGGADPAAEADADFNKGGAFGTQLTQSIESYADEIDPDQLQDVADAFTECPEFTSTDAAGTVSRITVSPMSFANLGDQTAAFAMTFEEEEGFAVSLNIAMVVVGHNLVSLLSGGLAGGDGAELEQIGRTAIAKLEQAAG